ncbi:MAG: TonB-dependent receptor [Lewinellaceae bacterium]|nr:TonB-dependent receptor [Phaeodactylibacter sp.]MCB0612513.1 TonB-dependent receptor [Phaeodactylibacter sp.]MCB9350770.1 TonB-dependent receptor [Lewinellaceae bacterium]
MKRLYFLIPCLLLFWSMELSGQERTLTGTVTSSEDGLGIIGANILLKGTSTGTITDFDGKYELKVPGPDAVLIFSYTGMRTEEITVGGQSVIDLAMAPDVEILEEVVVVGYGVQKKSVVTGAIASVSAEDIGQTPVLRIEQALQGRAAGVQVTNSSGQPGDAITVRIRGAGTTGSADPLYVVDGLPVGGIDYLNPGDIESIEVLKDAASAAIYGARAANGVVLITTKSGKEGKMQLSYDGYVGVQNPWRKLAMLNATEYALIQNEAAAASKLTIPFADPYALGEGTNWQDQLFNENAPILNHQVAVTGGNQKSTYAGTLSYFSQEGIVGGDKSQFDRYTARINSAHEVSDRFTFGQNLSFTHIDRRSIDGNNEFGGPLMSALNIDPITPVFETDPARLAAYDPNAVKDGDGNVYAISRYATQEVVNPLARLEVTNGKYKLDKIVGNVYGELEIIPRLKLRTSYGIDLAYGTNNSFRPIFFLNAAQISSESRVDKSVDRWFNWIWENTLSYEIGFGSHDFSFLAGTTAQENSYENLAGGKSDVVFSDFDNAFLNTAVNEESATAGGGASQSALLSYFGRVTYDFEDKYLFTGIVRVDGSSRFGENNRFGVFPSFSAGWVISQEPFLQGSDVLDFLKVRASWGQNGNQEIGDYRWASTIATGAGYSFGDGTVFTSGSVPATVPNPDLEWETSEQTDFGVDMRFWRGKISVTADYYIKKTIGLLVDAPIPGIVGNNAPTVNGGNVENKGFELAIDYRNKAGELDYNIGVNFSNNQNEVTAINNAEGVLVGAGFSTYGSVSRAAIGFPIAYFWGLQTDGLFQTVGDVENYTNGDGGLIQPGAAPGDIKFVDLNGDGVINDADRTIIGNPTPEWTYGANLSADYRNFDFSLFLLGTVGNEIFNGTRRHDLTTANMPARFLDRWTGEGTSNDIPRSTATDPNGNFSKISDFYIEDGSFLRVKDLQFGFSLPQGALDVLHIQHARIYVAAQNLLTITGYNGFDPEIGARSALDIGIDRGIYPQARSYRIGANVVF